MGYLENLVQGKGAHKFYSISIVYIGQSCQGRGSLFQEFGMMHTTSFNVKNEKRLPLADRLAPRLGDYSNYQMP